MKTKNVREVTKSIDWSYATSTNAERFGFTKTGCWTVSLNFYGTDSRGRECWTAEGKAGFTTKEAAIAFAETLGEPWAPWHHNARGTVDSEFKGTPSHQVESARRDEPVAVVSAEIADAFGMRGLPNVIVVEGRAS